MKYEITKGSEKDFEGAPEWALLKTGCYYFEGLDEGLRWAFFSSVSGIIIQEGSWLGCEDGIFNQHRRGIIAERRPITETVWDGEWLPPVGALCRYRDFSDMPWVECKVLAWHDDEVWLKRVDDGKTFTMGNPELFPIRSHEDVARDEAIEAMRDVGYTLPAAIRFTKEEMAALYDAGYRRPKPHANEAQECEHESTRPSAGGCICNDCGWTSW